MKLLLRLDFHSYLTRADFVSLANLSPPTFAYFSVSLKSAGTDQGLTRALQSPRDGSTLCPCFGCGCLSLTWGEFLGPFLCPVSVLLQAWTQGVVLPGADPRVQKWLDRYCSACPEGCSLWAVNCPAFVSACQLWNWLVL